MKDLQDLPEEWRVKETRKLARGYVSSFIEEDIYTPTGDVMTRQWTSHPGSVAIMALDEQDRLAMLQHYRHPVAAKCWEFPAGLLDIAGEDPLDAAKRELAEEAQLKAEQWNVVVDWYVNPGASQEQARIFLAQGLSKTELPAGFELLDEEADMKLSWVPFDAVMQGVLAGRINNPSVVIGCFAVAQARCSDSLNQLRPGDAPWPAMERKKGQDKRLA